MIPILIAAALAVGCAVMMFLERTGLRTTLTLSFKGDVKRESRFVAQYGQLFCTFVTALLIWQLDLTRGFRICEALWTSAIATMLIATTSKRLLGRARPRSEHAGKWLGPSFRHANYRESFPSSHSAGAFAYAGILASAYPGAAITFWSLALLCAVLRYLMDAHWPSDVLAGIALGLLVSTFTWRIFF
jgi:membrane-associated phospholipid phosphatase